MTVSADHIVVLILLLALTVKFIFFEDKAELERRLATAEIMSHRQQQQQQTTEQHTDGQDLCHGHSNTQLNVNLCKKFSPGSPELSSTPTFFLQRSDSLETESKEFKIKK